MPGASTGALARADALTLVEMLPHRPASTHMAHGDLDGDGLSDFVYVGSTMTWILPGATLSSATSLEDASVTVLSDGSTWIEDPGVLADRDGDGRSELILQTGDHTENPTRRQLLELGSPTGQTVVTDGTLLASGKNSPGDAHFFRALEAVDLDGDGYDELVFGGDSLEVCVLGPDDGEIQDCEGLATRLQATQKV